MDISYKSECGLHIDFFSKSVKQTFVGANKKCIIVTE